MEQRNGDIKKQILEELGYLSYMDKNKIKDDHDQVFIEKELKQIKSKKKSQFILGICWILLTFTYILLFVFDTKLVFTSKDIVLRIIVTIGYTILSFGYVYSYAENRRRESLFKILSVFTKQN